MFGFHVLHILYTQILDIQDLKKNVNSEFIVHNSGTLKTERLEGQIILVLGSNKTKGPKLDSQNQLRSPMSEREGTLVLIIITLFRNCKFQKKYI